jgi:hypothetical protein
VTDYYIVFEYQYDPRNEIPVEVYTDRWNAESAQLNLQQIRATAYNKSRAKSFKEGFAVGERKTAQDYAHQYSIKEV